MIYRETCTDPHQPIDYELQKIEIADGDTIKQYQKEFGDHPSSMDYFYSKLN